MIKLMKHQQEDFEYLKDKKSIGILNSPRTGKTFTAIAIFDY